MQTNTIDLLLHSLSGNLVDKASQKLRSLDHPLRRKMLQLIYREGYINVTEIYQRMGLEQTTASQHLAILREGGLVQTQREGKCIFYTVNNERLQEVGQLVRELVKD